MKDLLLVFAFIYAPLLWGTMMLLAVWMQGREKRKKDHE